jgi:hypothetical protein
MMESSLLKIWASAYPHQGSVRKLEKEGLVVIEPRKGAYASEVSSRTWKIFWRSEQTWKDWPPALRRKGKDGGRKEDLA